MFDICHFQLTLHYKVLKLTFAQRQIFIANPSFRSKLCINQWSNFQKCFPALSFIVKMCEHFRTLLAFKMSKLTA